LFVCGGMRGSPNVEMDRARGGFMGGREPTRFRAFMVRLDDSIGEQSSLIEFAANLGKRTAGQPLGNADEASMAYLVF
jgi:hypothetical protein